MSTTLRAVGFVLTAVFAGFCGVILVGYTISDVGGWAAVGLVAAAVVPLAALCLMARRWPSASVPLLAVVVCVPIGFGVMQTLDYGRWHGWEDRTGPVSLVLVLLAAVPLAVLGLVRPTAAGWLLLAATVLPILLPAVGAGTEWWEPLSIGMLLLPLVASGVVFVLAGRGSVPSGSAPHAGRFAH